MRRSQAIIAVAAVILVAIQCTARGPTKEIARMTFDVAALHAAFAKSGLPFRDRTVRCAGDRYHWVTIDVGSGGYLIHGYLYVLHHAAPHLVLHVMPEWGRITLDARAGRDRIVIAQTMAQGKRSQPVAEYYPPG